MILQYAALKILSYSDDNNIKFDFQMAKTSEEYNAIKTLLNFAETNNQAQEEQKKQSCQILAMMNV